MTSLFRCFKIKIAAFALATGFLSGCGRISIDSPVLTATQFSRETVANDEPCEVKMRARFAKDSETQIDWYMRHGGLVPAAEHRARFVPGTNGLAVVLVHGFLSSPERMNEIANPLIERGYSVYLPLLTGFSADAQAANASGPVEWRDSFRNAVETLQICHQEVSVVAHSLGAAVAVDELMNRRMSGVSRLILLAPYLHTYGSWLSITNEIFKSRTDVLDLNLARKTIGGDPYSYLPIERPRPGEPEPFLPLLALDRVLDLQNNFRRAFSSKSEIPVLVALAASDKVIDSAFAERFLGENFEQVNRIVYDTSSKIGHSLQVRMNNPRFDELLTAIQNELTDDPRTSVASSRP